MVPVFKNTYTSALTYDVYLIKLSVLNGEFHSMFIGKKLSKVTEESHETLMKTSANDMH